MVHEACRNQYSTKLSDLLAMNVTSNDTHGGIYPPTGKVGKVASLDDEWPPTVALHNRTDGGPV